MRLTLLLLALLWATLPHAPLRAQHTSPPLLTGPVSGLVTDAETGEALAGVTVLVQGTTVGTVTDREGRFVLSSAEGGALVFSLVGYGTRTVDLSSADGPLRIEMRPQLVDLQPLVVSASREEEPRARVPLAIAALSAEQLRAARPNLLYEALNMVAGVHVTNLGNEQHTMSIRQPLSYRALFVYLEDGVPIRPTGIFNHNALIEVNMAAVERIEVVRGPSSSHYGANAVGGAINFITARPTSSGASFSLRTDDRGYRRADLSGSARAGRLGIYVSGYAARQREGWAEHSDFDKRSLTARAEYAFAPATRLTTTLSTSHLDTDTNGSLDSLNFYGRGYSSLHTFTYRKVDATRLTSRLEHAWNGRQATDLTFFARNNVVGQLPHYRIRNVRNDPARAVGEVSEDRFQSLGFNVQHQAYYRFLDSRLILGAGMDRSPNSYLAYHLDVERDPASRRYTGFARSDSLLTDYGVDLLGAAAYAQAEVSPLRRVRLVGSLRYDRIQYGYDNHLSPSTFSGAPDERNGFSRLSPRFGVTYDLGGGRGLYANASQGFLPPEAGELYRGVKVPYLKPAYFNSYEAGGWAALAGGKAQADFSLYRMDGEDEIISVQLEDGSSHNANAGRTRHTGVEYGLALFPADGLTLRLSGANARHAFVRYEEAGERLDGRLMDAAPAWIANAEAAYRPPFLRGSRIGLEWQRVSPYFMDTRNTIRYGGYSLLHLRAGYEVRGVELWANVLNLTDTLYANIASKSRFGHQYNPGSPRSISIGAGYRFGSR